MSDRNKVSSPRPLSLPLPPFSFAAGRLGAINCRPGELQPINRVRIKDRWLHVRVISSDAKGETVRVNVPSNWRKRSSPLSTRNASITARSRSTTAHVKRRRPPRPRRGHPHGQRRRVRHRAEQ